MAIQEEIHICSPGLVKQFLEAVLLCYFPFQDKTFGKIIGTVF